MACMEAQRIGNTVTHNHGHRQPVNRHGETRNDDRLFSLPNLPQAPAHARLCMAACIGYTARLLPGMRRHQMRAVPAQNAGGAQCASLSNTGPNPGLS